MAKIANSDAISLAVWDVPMPVVVGETFAIKVGAKSASGGSLAGRRVHVNDATGGMVASGTIGASPWPGTEALYWVAIDVPAPAEPRVAEYTVRIVANSEHDNTATWFSVAAATRPEFTVTLNVTEQQTKAALGNVEIRLGAFHARTDASGRAEVRVCKGEYQLHLWRNAHVAPQTSVTIDGDASIDLTMVHVPEEHPDARWVR